MGYIKKKSERLGMRFEKANYRLKRDIIFWLSKKCGMHICYRCKKEIESIEDFSIEHKIGWLNSKNPAELFFDLDNIAFSHRRCNSKYNVQPKKRPWQRGSKNNASKLTESEVVEIKKELKEGKLGIRELGKKFNISHNQILAIQSGRHWSHVK